MAGNGASSKVALLDVNVLIALFDAEHIHHEVAHDWFSNTRAHGWATCPLTENGFVRILSNPRRSPFAERAAAVRDRLQQFCESGDHSFWPDAISIRDARIFRAPLPVGFKQVTDLYLLGLACHYGGCFVTFDKGIPLNAVTGATREHLQVLGPAPSDAPD
jgi:toxin-antitoxin system PIN domain toxin